MYLQAGSRTKTAACLVLCLALILATPGLPGFAVAGDRKSDDIEKVADGVYLFQSDRQRSLFLVGDTGVIVTDPLNGAASVAYRRAISSVTRLPVKYVVYSHYHWDRVAGGQIFKEEGAMIIAQERCAQRFKANPNPDVVMPDITFAERMDINIGDMTLEMHYFGPSHGDCLSVFLVEPAGLIQVVDVVNPPQASFPDNPNVPFIKPHNLRQFFSAVEKLAKNRDVNGVLASHAGPATGPVTLINDQAVFWNSIYGSVETARAQGKVGLDSFVTMDAIDLSTYQHYLGYEPADLPIIMRRFVGFYDMGR